ncbi:MAG: PQQ-binding-like beta-propeller repeat protein [Fuerstiella sp.]
MPASFKRLWLLPSRTVFWGDRHNTGCRLIFPICIFFAAVFADAAVAAPQDEPTDDGAEVQWNLAQTLATDRNVLTAMESHRKRLAAKEFAAAADDFRRLRTADPFTLVPSPAYPGVFIPLHKALFAVAWEIPPDVARNLVETVESVAEIQLQSVLDEGKSRLLPAVICQFAGTKASIKAHFVLARIHLNRGNREAAEEWLRPISRPGIPAEYRIAAESILADLSADKQSSATGSSATGSSNAVQQIPKHLVWQSRTAASPKLRDQVEVFQKTAYAAGVVPETVWDVVAQGQTAFRRTLRGLECMDITTGSARWEYPIGFGLDSMISSNRSNASVFNEAKRDPLATVSFARMDQSPFANVFCRDNLLGGVCQDASRVYAVATDSEYQASSYSNRGFRPSGASGFQGNRLIALDKETGARIWSLGRATFEEHLGVAESSCWIAGLPEKNGKQLYCVVEWNSEIRLACISAETGELNWTVPLAFPEQTIDKDVVRRYWAVKPLRVGGLIWSLTTAGSLVCVDEVSQSIVYATAIQEESSTESRPPTGRGQPVVFTRPLAMTGRWPKSRIVAINGAIVVMAHESHDIVVIEPESGGLIRRIEVEPGTVVVHVDEKQIVLGTIGDLKCVAAKSGNQLWVRPLTETQGAVTGEGVRVGARLLCPMSTGAIAAVNLSSGEFSETIDQVLPKDGWGKLMLPSDLQGDILYTAPDRMTRLSSQPPTTVPEDPLEVASGLMASGKWLSALKMAESVPATDSSRVEADDIIFQSRLQLAAEDPDRYLAELLQSPLSNSQKLQVQVFEASVSFNERRYDAATDQLLGILALNSSILSMPAPLQLAESERPVKADDFSRAESSGQTKIQAALPLITWAATRLSQCLDHVALNDSQTERLSQLPDTVLLSIYHPVVTTTLRQRAEQTASDETALHLLQHSIAVHSKFEPGRSDGIQPELQVLQDRIKSRLASLNVGKARLPSESAVRRLISAVVAEFPADVNAGLRQAVSESASTAVSSPTSPSPDSSLADAAFVSRLQGRFAEWKEQPYQTVPTTRLSSSNRKSSTMMASETNDPFLREYSWTVVQGDYGRVLAKSVSDIGEQWSIPGNFEGDGTYWYRNDLLLRVGSVVLLQSYRSVTGISVFDGRVLWTKNVSMQSGIGGSSIQPGSFSAFVAGRNHLPSWQSLSPYRIVGWGDRWVCIKHGLQLEVIDMYSGQTCWSLSLSDSHSHVIATDDIVLVNSPSTAAVTCFDRADGHLVSIAAADRLAETAIRNVKSLLVCWNKPVDGTAGRLTWIDPLTEKIHNEVSLGDSKQFHFVDENTLVGINDQQQFLVVNLLNGSTEKCSFRIEGKDSPDAAATELDEHNGPPDLPLWDPARVQIYSDAVNYYVSNRASNNASSRQPYGRQMMRFDGGLRAVARDTGSVRWWVYNDVTQLASTDQPELPVLVLVQDSMTNVVGANSAVSQNVFRGIAKLSGDQLFEQPVPSQYGIRFVSIDSPAANILDIGVQGMRVRLEPESLLLKTSPQQGLRAKP